jgi:nucleotidyltransferase substrate binding protein (TIGR01987 family)
MQDIRWKQRFENFDRAVALLRGSFEKGVDNLSDLEKEGAVRRFEFAFELAWKTLKDYLGFSGIVVKPATPREVIKEAYAVNILADGQVWTNMLEHRNQLSHMYDEAVFDDAVRPSLPAAHAWLAPFPPGIIRKSLPSAVSPGAGRRATDTTKSMFRLPTTASAGFICRGRCRAF